MKVDDYFFSWQHGESATMCCAYKNPPKGSLKAVLPVAIGVSKLHPNDRYDAAVGRKVSLLKVLQELTKENLIKDDFRPKAWEVYRTMTKVPRWPVTVRVH